MFLTATQGPRAVDCIATLSVASAYGLAELRQASVDPGYWTQASGLTLFKTPSRSRSCDVIPSHVPPGSGAPSNSEGVFRNAEARCGHIPALAQRCTATRASAPGSSSARGTEGGSRSTAHRHAFDPSHWPNCSPTALPHDPIGPRPRPRQRERPRREAIGRGPSAGPRRLRRECAREIRAGAGCSRGGGAAGAGPPRGWGPTPPEGGGRGARESCPRARPSALHPSRPGASARATAAAAAASSSLRASRRSPQPNRPERWSPDAQGRARARTCSRNRSPAPGSTAPEPRSALRTRWAAGIPYTDRGTRGGFPGARNGCRAGHGWPDLWLPALLESWLRGSASPGREGQAVGRPAWRGVASGGPLTSGGPARPPSECLQA
ncbi:uncharacterized protein LOC110598858 [Ictidomys tridecemlineatus]